MEVVKAGAVGQVMFDLERSGDAVVPSLHAFQQYHEFVTAQARNRVGFAHAIP